MSNNTLPDEVMAEINDRATVVNPVLPVILQGERIDINYIKRAVWMDGATEYATKLYEAQQALDKAKDLLAEATTQIEYMHKKFKETGSGNNFLSRIETFLDGQKY